MGEKIRPTHLNRLAYVYVRQSTLAQVRFHTESTERQYALQEKARQLGWATESIRVIDEDLGMSGAQSSSRTGFQRLVAEVSLGQVGAILGLEVSRLARSSADWHRLLELCALFDTLILDADGIYDLSDFNDRLLLGLKGTMSEAELHLLRGRLQGGKQNKARKGELRFPLPVGFVYDEDGQIVLDPDQEVQAAVRAVFAAFRRTGSAFGVVRHFAREGLRFPKRAYGGAWAGRLIWGRLTHRRVLDMLTNPAYAGIYVFGRFHGRKQVTSQGQVRSVIVRLPPAQWQVRIPGHHPGYLSEAQFADNQRRLEQNRTNAVVSGAAREGTALLQGILLCGNCGHRMTVRYTGNGGINPRYECGHAHRDGVYQPHCRSLPGPMLDDAIAARVLEALRPAELELAVQAIDELQRAEHAADEAWRLRVERARYEADRAERQYTLAEPENRLVARTLETRWNERLAELQRLQDDYEHHRATTVGARLAATREQILALAQDLPRLWQAATTTAKDRKRIIRLLIADVTARSIPGSRQVELGIRWQSGRSEVLQLTRPAPTFEQRRCPPQIVTLVRELACSRTDDQIAAHLNAGGHLAPTGRPFARATVRWIRFRYRIPGPTVGDPEALSVTQVADRLGVSTGVVYYWLQHGYLKGSKQAPGWPWRITLDAETERQLIERVKSSGHLRRLESQRV